MKVVPFERNAAYLHHRAMKNRRSLNTLDALELLRHAVEDSPKNREYELDLAELYCEMGCHAQSNRILLDMFAQGNASPECYYGLALNRIGMRDFQGAKRALGLYHKMAQDDEHIDEARQLIMQLDFEMYFRHMSENRKKQRGIHMQQMAFAHVDAEEWEQAKDLYERSFAFAVGNAEDIAFYAMSLQKLHRDAEAVSKARDVLKLSELSCTALRVVGKVFYDVGLTEEGRKLLRQAAEKRPFGMEAEDLMYTMRESGMAAEADECARLALQDTPFDRKLLHVRAVNALQLWDDWHTAKQYYVRILRIDPSDSIAEYYCDAIERHALNKDELSYEYEVPEAECRRRWDVIAGYIRRAQDDTTAPKRLWNTKPNLKKLTQWALTWKNEDCLMATMTFLSMIKSAKAVSMVRETCNRSDVPMEIKRKALEQYMMRNIDPHTIFPLEEDFQANMLPSGEVILQTMSAGHRQVMRHAASVVAEKTHEDALPELAILWGIYCENRGTKCDALLTAEGAAAALYYCYQTEHEGKPTLSATAKRFGCTERQMRYYVRQMQSALYEEKER